METEESNKPVTSPAVPAEQSVESTGCKACGAEPEPGSPLPLCSNCRTKLARRPIPIGIKLAGALVGLLIIFALTRIPTSMSAAVAFERGLAAEKRGDFAGAEKQYQKSAAAFQKSDRVHGRLFVASYRAGDSAIARQEFDFLKGREIDSALISVGPFLVNTIIGAIVSFPAAIPVIKFGAGDLLDYFLIWLGVSIAMHAIPSTGDAKSMWQSVKDVSPITRLLVMPILGVIYLATIGRFFWLDLFYGIGVAIGLPTLAVAIYSYFV